MAYLIYELLGVVALCTSYIHCQQASDVFGHAFQVGASDTASFLSQLFPTGRLEDTDTSLSVSVTESCQSVASVSNCGIGDTSGSSAVGTSLTSDVSAETVPLISQSLPTSATSGSFLQTTPADAPASPDATPSVSPSTILASTPMPSSSTDISSFITGTSTPSSIAGTASSFAMSTPTSSSISTGSNGALKKTTSSAAVAGGVVGGIIVLLLILFICWFVRRRQRAKQLAYLKATRATVYSETFGASNYSASATAASAPRQDIKQAIDEGYSDSKRGSCTSERNSGYAWRVESQEQTIRVEGRGVVRSDFPLNYEE